jgi:hypothetical protein
LTKGELSAGEWEWERVERTLEYSNFKRGPSSSPFASKRNNNAQKALQMSLK